MAKKRFSSKQLYSMRNDIPITDVIKYALGIPWRNTEGCFRFLCPLCNECNTAVNPITNLARCFTCEKNFNVIDLVMLINQCDFVTSVRFLKGYKTRGSIQLKNPGLTAHTGSPAHIGDVLESVISASRSAPASANENLCDRILKLEQKLDRLAQCIEKIINSPV